MTTAELRHLTDIDHRDHDALLAFDPGTGAAVAVARYIRDPRHADAAELAVLVGDHWQARGLGTAVSSRLAQRARANGIRRFRTPTLADNQPALKLIERLGSTSFLRDGPTVEIEVKLTATPPSGPSRQAPPPGIQKAGAARSGRGGPNLAVERRRPGEPGHTPGRVEPEPRSR